MFSVTVSSIRVEYKSHTLLSSDVTRTDARAIHSAPGARRVSARVALVIGRSGAARRLVAVDAREVADAADICDRRRDPRVCQRRRGGRVAVSRVHFEKCIAAFLLITDNLLLVALNFF